MKVLFLVTNFARWEGDPHSPWLVDLAIRLRERGIAPSVWAPSYRGQGDHTIQQIPVHRFRYAPAPWEQLTHNEGAPNKLANPFYLPLVPFYLAGGLLDIRRRMSAQHYDVLHVHWPLPTALFGLAARRRNGMRLVASFHGAELMLARRYPGLQPVLKRLTRDFDAISANSAFTARLVREITGKEAVVIPYGSTIGEHDSPSTETAPVTKDKPATILFVGRLIERKGVPYLIEAMAHLNRQTPAATLNIVGTGSEQAALEQMATERGIRDDIRFLGRVSSQELAHLYATCDAFALPSIVDRHGDTEGLGVVLLEAMSHGRPVVATNVGGIPDIVKHESTGLLVPEKDAPALARALNRLLTDEELAERLGQAGQDYTRAHFTWSSIVDRIIELYGGA
ncbi:MAG: glycosyltransferase family 4 protein [Chloroflexi bacterium]|nr:glycosyltransferase family 4 protein [Chloroflexota bacterium]